MADVRRETVRARTLVLDVDGWPGHKAGQHVDVRLTAEDGYQAQRCYSIASAAGRAARDHRRAAHDGEVSPGSSTSAAGATARAARPDRRLLRLGAVARRPLLLVAGGSGLVPLMCIERLRRLAAPAIESTLLLSARGPEDVLYAGELDGAALTYTRRTPAGWTGYDRRIDAAMLAQLAPPPDSHPRCFVCGPTGFVEHVAQDLVDLGHERALVKTERFGASGG